MNSKKKYNNYTLSIFVTTLIGVALIIPALLLHALKLGALSGWLIDFVSGVYGLAFVSRLVSGSGYASSLLDSLTHKYTVLELFLPKSTNHPKSDTITLLSASKNINAKTKKSRIGQKVGNLLGFISGTVFAVATIILRAVTPNIINAVISTGFYLINHISNFSGLFNRGGKVIDFLHEDSNQSRLRRKNVNYVIGVIVGAIAGAALISVILFVVGATSAMSLGGAVPLWLSLGILVIGTISTGASAGGYIGRCVDFLFGERTVVHVIADTVNNVKPTQSIRDRVNCESSGTLIGVAAGVILATVLVAAGVASLSFFGLGLPTLFAGMVLMTACVSQCGGLGNRIGHMIDKYRGSGKLQQDIKVEITPSKDSIYRDTPPDNVIAKKSHSVAGKENNTESNSTGETHDSLDQPAAQTVNVLPPVIAVKQNENILQVAIEKEKYPNDLSTAQKLHSKNGVNTFSIKDVVKQGLFKEKMHTRSKQPVITEPVIQQLLTPGFASAA